MPPRAHLRDADIDLLYGYLTQLAGAPGASVPAQATVSWARVGENVVKGTCHVCHDAAGPRPSGKALLDGATPPLSSLIADKSVADFVNKVRVGAPILMGDLPVHYRGRMPVFYYLKDQEVAAAYLFLASYPPQAK
jgi:mono/diheme cytochrome c family protein